MTPEQQAAYSEIIKIAAALVRGENCMSEYREDYSGAVSKSILRSVAAQNDHLKVLALKLRHAADKLRPARKP
jgi:hypothetical protein